jgi:tetratricopeptide (TPR) repeat protein
LLARITGASGQRPLDLLTGGPRDHPVYQQTLRGTIDWSYQLLTEDEQQLFERLGVFVGDGTIEAIEAICNATHDLRITVFDGLISLEEKSLLRQTRVQAGDPRFGMLATIRTYALERLSERAEYAQIQQHYASWVLGLVEEAEAHLHTVDELAWLDRLEAELENVRGVMAWALKQSDPTLSAQLASALGEFCWARGYVTLGRHWLTSVLARHEQIVAVVRAKALARCGMLAWIQGDYNEAIDHCQAALALYQNLDIASGCAWTLRHLAYVLWDQGNYEATQALLTESLACARADGNRSASARALHMLGWVAVHRGDETLAVACYEECLALSRAVGDRQFIAHSLNDLGLVWQRRGDYRQATALIESGMGLRRELTINVGIAWSCLNLGLVARDQHDYPRATRWFRESLRLRQDLGDRRGIAECLEALAAVASLENLPAHAAHYYGAAAQLRETIGAPLRSFEHAEYERYVARVRAALGAKQFMRDWTVGQHMRLAEVLGEHDVMVAE